MSNMDFDKFRYAELSPDEAVCHFCDELELELLDPGAKPGAGRYRCDRCERVYGDRIIGSTPRDRERKRLERARARARAKEMA